MAAPQVVPLVPGISVSGDYTIRLTALDATTGNLVTGVKVSNAAILGSVIAGASTTLEPVGPFTLVPGPSG